MLLARNLPPVVRKNRAKFKAYHQFSQDMDYFTKSVSVIGLKPGVPTGPPSLPSSQASSRRS